MKINPQKLHSIETDSRVIIFSKSPLSKGAEVIAEFSKCDLGGVTYRAFECGVYPQYEVKQSNALIAP